MSNSPSQTNLSLLNQLRTAPTDSNSWKQFVSMYGPKIKKWCMNWGLQATDADDVTQNVLVAIAKQMKDFEYDPKGRFRSWLKTISYRAWVDFLKLRKRHSPGTGSDAVHEMLNSVKTREDFLQKMDEECERSLLEEAMIVVQRRVNEDNWRAFQMTALDGVSGSDAAKSLNMQITSVYQAKSRIQKMLKQQMQSLDQFDNAHFN